MAMDLSAPDRLFHTSIYVGRSTEVEMGVAGKGTPVRFTFDLDGVMNVREYVDFDGDYPGESLATVEFANGDSALVRSSYDEVLAGWTAHRRHADKDAWLRN